MTRSALQEDFLSVHNDKSVIFMDMDGDLVKIWLAEEALDSRNPTVLSPIQLKMSINEKEILGKLDAQNELIPFSDAVEYLEWDEESRRLRTPERASVPVPNTVNISWIKHLVDTAKRVAMKGCEWRVGSVPGVPVAGSARSQETSADRWVGSPAVSHCTTPHTSPCSSAAMLQEAEGPDHEQTFKDQMRKKGGIPGILLMKKIDLDNNHVVDKSEFLGAGGTEEQFAEFDKDGDGLIDAKELAVAVERGGWAIAGEQL